MLNLKILISLVLYLLAVINPISKIFVLSGLLKEHTPKEIRQLAVRASTIGLIVLLLFAFAGNLIFTYIFHIELYSFRITAGVILFVIGFRALSKGIFFEMDVKTRLSDLAIVPLVSPMIAGPGTIATVISFSAEYGLYLSAVAAAAAILINLLVMLASGPISRFLNKYHLMGVLIRMAGMIVATIAVQMILTGIMEWHKSL